MRIEAASTTAPLTPFVRVTKPQVLARNRPSSHLCCASGGRSHPSHSQGDPDPPGSTASVNWLDISSDETQTCSWSHTGTAEGLTTPEPEPLGQRKPSSSMVNGGGIAGSTYVVGDTIMSAKPGGGTTGAGVLIPLPKPTLRRRLASMIRRVRAYLESKVRTGVYNIR